MPAFHLGGSPVRRTGLLLTVLLTISASLGLKASSGLPHNLATGPRDIHGPGADTARRLLATGRGKQRPSDGAVPAGGGPMPWQQRQQQVDSSSAASAATALAAAAAGTERGPVPPVPYENAHVHDLRGMVARRCHRSHADPDMQLATCRWISVITLNHLEPKSKEELLLMNTLVSLVLVAGHDTYLVACATEQALQACQRLGLPCFDASAVVAAAELDIEGQLGREQPNALPTYWSKVAVANEVLQVLPPDAYLHVSDYDVVYLKRVYPSAEFFFKNQTGNHADATMAYENWADREQHNIYIANTGVVFIRNNEMSALMYRRWLAAASPRHHDQTGFARLYGKAYLFCSDPLLCGVTRSIANMPAVARHHTAWANNTVCPDCKDLPVAGGAKDQPSHRLQCYLHSSRDHCKVPYRLYVHLICMSKIPTLQALGLWFLDPKKPRDINYIAIKKAGLPCGPPHDVARMRAVP